MNYGLYMSAAGAQSAIHRQNVLANNLANVETIGFKPDAVFTQAREVERLEDAQVTFAPPQWTLEQLGGGILNAPTYTTPIQGTLMQSTNEMDLGIEGAGYFVVASIDGNGRVDASAEGQRLTRDGRFVLNGSGELVMASTGMAVLDVANQPIVLDRTLPVDVLENGAIIQGGVPVAQIQLASPSSAESLRKAGANTLRIDRDLYPAAALSPATGRVRQSMNEASGVDPVLTLNGMINATKAVQANAKMIQFHDHILGQLFSTVGRVA